MTTVSLCLTTSASSKLRAELAAFVVDAILTQAIEQRTDRAEAQLLAETRERLIEEYRKGGPLKFVREALEQGESRARFDPWGRACLKGHSS